MKTTMDRRDTMACCFALAALLYACAGCDAEGAGDVPGDTTPSLGAPRRGAGAASSGTGGQTSQATSTVLPGAGGQTGTGGQVGTGGATVAAVVAPSSTTIPGWVVDQSVSKTSGMVAATATTAQGATDLIGSAAANFFAAPYSPVTFAWQNYVNASLVSPQNSTSGSTLKLYILQMPSADQACGLYTSLLSASLYRLTWADPTSPTVATKSRIADSGTDWWINFCKGNYYVEVRMTPSYAADLTPGDPAQKQAAMDFAVAVAAKM